VMYYTHATLANWEMDAALGRNIYRVSGWKFPICFPI